VVATLARKSKLVRFAGWVDRSFPIFEQILVRVVLFAIFVFGLLKILMILL
jgi:hypothetical protein